MISSERGFRTGQGLLKSPASDNHLPGHRRRKPAARASPASRSAGLPDAPRLDPRLRRGLVPDRSMAGRGAGDQGSATTPSSPWLPRSSAAGSVSRGSVVQHLEGELRRDIAACPRRLSYKFESGPRPRACAPPSPAAEDRGPAEGGRWLSGTLPAVQAAADTTSGG
ncbi:hypothetical protein ACRAWD_20020 [Caulobacter segnis]